MKSSPGGEGISDNASVFSASLGRDSSHHGTRLGSFNKKKEVVDFESS